jgi:hypothetical protein
MRDFVIVRLVAYGGRCAAPRCGERGLLSSEKPRGIWAASIWP